jgi:hypothetical protein
VGYVDALYQLMKIIIMKLPAIVPDNEPFRNWAWRALITDIWRRRKPADLRRWLETAGRGSIGKEKSDAAGKDSSFVDSM